MGKLITKKSLGQHFLRDPHILGKIVDGANLSLEDTVLEVGPGEGTLTELLIAKAGKVIAVEKDDRLIPILKEKFHHEISDGKLELIHADILTLPTTYNLLPTTYKIVANLPYYITGEFLRTVLSSENQPTDMTLLLQKEVVRRITGVSESGNRKESLLSISVKVYGEPKCIATVKAGSFSPPPKVDSAILSIEQISKDFFSEITEKKFFSVVKKGFSHPRKLLSSNLGVPKETLTGCGIPEKARAENLSVAQWKHIATSICRTSSLKNVRS